MEKGRTLTRILGIGGTVLAWFPIAAPILLTIGFLIATGSLRFDYLMPAELAFSALLGAALLFWAAMRAHVRPWWVAITLAVAVVGLLGSQGLAVVTGLAHGDTEPVGWPFAGVLSLLGLYTLAVIGLGVLGILLLRDLYRPGSRLGGTGQSG